MKLYWIIATLYYSGPFRLFPGRLFRFQDDRS